MKTTLIHIQTGLNYKTKAEFNQKAELWSQDEGIVHKCQVGLSHLFTYINVDFIKIALLIQRKKSPMSLISFTIISLFMFLLWLIESLFGEMLPCSHAQSICCPLCVRSICSAPMFDLKDTLFSQYGHRQNPRRAIGKTVWILLSKWKLDAGHLNLINNFNSTMKGGHSCSYFPHIQ